MPSKIPFEKVLEIINTLGYELRSEYKNTRSKINIYCKKHNQLYDTSIASLRDGHLLKCCGWEKRANNLKYTLDEAKSICLNSGYEYLDSSYDFCDTFRNFKCIKHNKVFKNKFIHISTGGYLKCCANERIRESKLYKIDDVKKLSFDCGFEFLEDVYKGGQTKGRFRCLKHDKIMLSTFSSVIKNKSMRCCQIEKMTGEKNRNYNPNLTDEERNFKRDNIKTGYSRWRQSVYERDNYTCQVCGDDTGHNLNAHHILNWAHNKDKRFDLENGITMCFSCHIKLHKEFGYNTNTNHLDFFIEEYRMSRV